LVVGSIAGVCLGSGRGRQLAAWRLDPKLANLRPPARIDVFDPESDLPPELGFRAGCRNFWANGFHVAPAA